MLLCLFGEIEWRLFLGLLIAGVTFKVIIAALDTPFLYLVSIGLENGLSLRSIKNYKLTRIYLDPQPALRYSEH